MPSSLSWRRVTKIRGATCGRPKVKTSCARSTPPDRRSPPSSPTVTLFQRRHTRRRLAIIASKERMLALTEQRVIESLEVTEERVIGTIAALAFYDPREVLSGDADHGDLYVAEVC